MGFSSAADVPHTSAPAYVADFVTTSRPGTRRLALALMIASGFAGLGYQIVWTQQAAVWLGHESAAVFAVVAAFFGGLSIGALLLGPRIDRSSKPARWYAACEAAIGAWSIVLAYLLAPVSGWMLELIGAQPSPGWHAFVAFCGTFLLLLPATVAMGATLPAMERALSTLDGRRTPIAVLYAGNTLGGVLGVLATAFWLIPTFGLLLTASACALLNLACAVTAAKLFVAPMNTPSATQLGACPSNVHRSEGESTASYFHRSFEAHSLSYVTKRIDEKSRCGSSAVDEHYSDRLLVKVPVQ